MAPKNRPNADISQPFKFRRDDQVCDRWPASQVRIASLVLRIPSFSLSLGPFFSANDEEKSEVKRANFSSLGA